jgi:RNA polymerase sporulation-specific sigma factor
VTAPSAEPQTDFGSLFQSWRQGDRRARDRLIESNLGLVGAIVGKFCGPGEDREDLFQVGSVGLIKALERFDPSRGFNFSTYAFHTILGEVRRYLRDKGPLHVSRSLKEQASRVRRERARLAQELGREPTLKEIAAVLGIDESDVAAALEAGAGVVSLYEEVGSKEKPEPLYLLDRIGAPPQDVTERLALAESLEALPALEQDVLKMRYFAELTQQEVARRLGISQSQVSRVERGAIVKLRRMLA